MPIETKWIDKESDSPIFFYAFTDRWTWTDVYNAIQTLRKDGDTMPYFDIIVDLTTSKGIPGGALTHLRGLSHGIRVDQWGICALINADGMAKALLQVIRSILPVFRDRFVFATDVENAIHEVKRWRIAHLPPKVSAAAGGTMPIRKAAVIGSGTMGGGIAALLTGIGVETSLLDLPAPGTSLGDPHEQRNAIALAGMERLKAGGSMPPLFDPADADKIHVGNLDDDLALVAQCDWVIEVVVERLEVKQDLMRRLAPLVRPDVILSTNTSGLPIDAIAGELSPALRSRFLGTHFFNPPRYLKLLEMIPGSETDPAVVETMRAFATDRLEKGVVICKDTPNFIGNRFMTMLGMQTVNAALDGGFTVEEIDALTGPLIGRPKTASFRLNDLVGIDIVVAIARNLYPAIPADPARALLQHAAANALFDRMLANTWLGNKTKQGFYKAVKNEAGEREFWALNLTTFEYHPAAAPIFESVSKHSAIPDTGARIKALMAEDDRAARFLRQHLAFYLAYASQRVPEIADSLVSIDNAQKWGFSHELGPFEIWDALGAAETVPVFEALGFPVAAWVKTMLANGISSFYRRENGQITGVYSVANGSYAPLS